MRLGICDICNREMMPEEYGYYIRIKSLYNGTGIDAHCCDACFYRHFHKGLIAIGDGAYEAAKCESGRDE